MSTDDRHVFIDNYRLTISKFINGIANLDIEADFKEEKSYCINLWDIKWDKDKGKYIREISKTEIPQVGGVKYKLRLK